MEFTCPVCQSFIPNDHVNVVTDMAQCPACKNVTRLSELSTPAEKPVSDVPPAGSQVEVKKDIGGLEIKLPRRKPQISDLGGIVFSLFWLGFIGFWTWGAWGGGGFFAMFSIPFWIIGFFMLGNTINSLLQVQIIKIDTQQISLAKERPLFSVRKNILLKDIQAVKRSNAGIRNFNFQSSWSNRSGNGKNNGLEKPAIITGSGTTHFFEEANEAEQDWIMGLIKRKASKK